MDMDLIIPVLARWLHIGPVIVLAGGAFFMRFVMVPSAGETLSDEQHDKLRAAIIGRWRKVLHACIALILISGMYNFYHGIVVLHKPMLYHILFLPKFLSALGIFFLASALVGKSPAFEHMRREPRKWLGMSVALAALIVVLSGIMKNLPDKATGQDDPTGSLMHEQESGSL